MDFKGGDVPKINRYNVFLENGAVLVRKSDTGAYVFVGDIQDILLENQSLKSSLDRAMAETFHAKMSKIELYEEKISGLLKWEEVTESLKKEKKNEP